MPRRGHGSGTAGCGTLVTASTAGIGASIAETLAGEGCNVAICSRSRDRVDAMLERLSARPGHHAGPALDVTDREAFKRWLDDAAAELGDVSDQVRHNDPDAYGKLLKRNPTGRPGTPEEMARTVAFVGKPAATFITGHPSVTAIDIDPVDDRRSRQVFSTTVALLNAGLDK